MRLGTVIRHGLSKESIHSMLSGLLESGHSKRWPKCRDGFLSSPMQQIFFGFATFSFLLSAVGCHKADVGGPPQTSQQTTDKNASTSDTSIPAAVTAPGPPAGGVIVMSTDELTEKMDFMGHFKPTEITDDLAKKAIEVSGKIERIESKGLNGKPSFHILSEGSKKISISCALEGQSPDFPARYGIGQTVTLRGMPGTYKQFDFSDPEPDFLWWVAEAGSNPVPIVKADDFAKDFKTDPTGTSEKLFFHAFYIVGEVVEVGEPSSDHVDVILKGQDDLNLRLATDERLIEGLNLKPGSKVQFQVQYRALEDVGGRKQLYFVNCVPVTTSLPAPGVVYDSVPPKP